MALEKHQRFWGWNSQLLSRCQEWPRFLEQSAVPVLAFLGASFLVALLSRQFLRVVTVWRKNEEERKAEKVRKIQQLGVLKLFFLLCFIGFFLVSSMEPEHENHFWKMFVGHLNVILSFGSIISS